MVDHYDYKQKNHLKNHPNDVINIFGLKRMNYSSNKILLTLKKKKTINLKNLTFGGLFVIQFYEAAALKASVASGLLENEGKTFHGFL